MVHLGLVFVTTFSKHDTNCCCRILLCVLSVPHYRSDIGACHHLDVVRLHLCGRGSDGDNSFGQLRLPLRNDFADRVHGKDVGAAIM